MSTAAATLSSQQQIADYRDVVVPSNLIVAEWTMRRGRYDRFILRHAADADIQKGADNHPEYKGKQRINRVCGHQSKLSATSRVIWRFRYISASAAVVNSKQPAAI